MMTISPSAELAPQKDHRRRAFARLWHELQSAVIAARRDESLRAPWVNPATAANKVLREVYGDRLPPPGHAV